MIVKVADGTGQSTDVDIAAAVRFIFDRAAALGAPAVANISLGSDFGPHDGTTPLEKTLADMVGPERPGRAIVVAAGNSGVLYKGNASDLPLGVHTQTRVTQGVPARAVLKAFSIFRESQVSGRVSIWLTFGANDDIAVGLEGPTGLSIPLVGRGAKAAGSTADRGLNAAIYNGVVDPNVTLTADTQGAIVLWTGSWPTADEMALRFEGEGFVDAWVESNPDGASGDFAEFFEVATREGTINVPATSPALITVGCTVNRTQWTDGDLHDHDATRSEYFGRLLPADGICYFSSAGPTAAGVAKPEISAPGATIIGAMSSDAVPGRGHESVFDAPEGACPDGNHCLVVDAKHAVLSGSSMSSPQVAGAIALLFERDAALTQPDVLLLLQEGARRPHATIDVDYQLGAGALAVDGAISALEARSSAIVREPDAAQSWMSLSGGYARPDLGYAIAGTVEVRAADGTIADGFDLARLSLDVSGEGAVTGPLARVAPGLFRFEVRARPDTGSSSIGVDVRLDGASIGERDSGLSGHRSIPIGADRWIARGSPRAYGGCSIAARAEERGGSGATGVWRRVPWSLPLFALFARRKRNGPKAVPRQR